MTLSYNISHHGGNSTHAIWIKYFTIKCEVKDTNIHLQTPIDQFLISIFHYQPIDIRAVKKEIKKSHNQTELEQNLAQLFLFNEINIGNVFAFSRFLEEKISSCSTPTNLDLIPQFLMRGYIAFTYLFPNLFEKYLNKEQMDNFQAEYWEIFHYPLQYLLKEPNTLFKETISIILPILNYIRIDSILNLENSDFLKIGFNNFLSTLINCFSFELECGTSHLFSFLIQALHNYSARLLEITNFMEIVGLFGHFFQRLQNVSNHVTDEQAQQIFTIFINIINTISSFRDNSIYALNDNNDNSTDDKNNNRTSFMNIINFSIHSFNCLPSILPKYTDDQKFKIIKSILSFLLWITNMIPYNTMFQSVGEYQVFSFKQKELKYNEWSTYYKENILLPEKLTKQIKLIRVQNIVNALENFFKNSLSFLSPILDTFSKQLADFEDDKKYLISIFIFISLLKIKNLDTSTINQSFLSTNIYESAFPSDLSTEIPPIALHFQEVFLKFVYFFCCYKEENLVSVLKVISKKIINENFEKMGHFLPLLRSLLLHDSKIQFVHCFIESGIVENLHSFLFISKNEALIDQIASFYQLIAITRPMEVFHSSSFLLALRNLVLIDRLQQLLSPCFKIGISLSYTPPFQTGKQCVHDTLEQAFSIVKQALKDEKTRDLAIEIVTYITDQVKLIDFSVIDEFVSQFAAVSKLPSIIPTSNAFLKCLKFFNKLCARFPQFLKYANTNNSAIIRNFEFEAPKIKITQEIIDCLIAFMLNSNEIKESKIKNRAALRLLLQISKETEFENFVLNFLLKTCRNSMFNNFECFSCDVIGFVLNRITNHLQLSLELFKVIGSKFFSPLALNQTFKAMRLVDGKRCKHHQILLDTFQSMLVECRSSPVNSFFHFSSDGEGVVAKNLDPSIFNEPYSIASYFKIEKFCEKFYPILTISENGKNSLLSFFMKSDMFVIQFNQHPGYVLRKNFVDSNWYKLIIVIHPAIIQVFINDAELTSLPIAKHDFRNEVTVAFGVKDQKSFNGDFGPTIFVKSTNLQEINEIYQQVNLSRIHMRSTFIKFLPWLVKTETINDVVLDNDSYPFSGDAIPSCRTIAQMIYFEGTFQKFLPLFVLLNYPIENEETQKEDENKEFVNDDERFFISVLLTFENLLKISEKMQKSFEKIGGFKLFAGFISSMRSEIFTAKIANQFESIFNALTLKSLKIEMIEQIWLNFNLWSSMSFEFQMTIYNILDKIWTSNQAFMLQKVSPNILLYHTQCTFTEIQKTKRKLMLFDLDKQIDNVPVELTTEEKLKIKNFQWKLFINYTINKPTAALYMNILMILSFHSSFNTQLFATEIIEITMRTNVNQLKIAFENIDEYEFFLNVFSRSRSIKLRANVMRCIFLLGVNERCAKLTVKSMEFKQAVFILIQYMITLMKSKKEKAVLFKVCFQFLYENYYSNPKPQEISNPEALLPLFALSINVQREELVKYSLIMLNDFAQFSTAVSFLFTLDSWPIWCFIFAYNCYDIEADCHTFSYFFSILFNWPLKSGRIDIINTFIVFLDLLKMYTNTDFNQVKKDTISLLITFAAQHKLNLDILINLLVVALRFLFIEITFDSSSTEVLNNEFLLTLIQKFQSSTVIEDAQNQKGTFRITFKEAENSNADFVIEVLSMIVCIIEYDNDAEIEFNGILLNVFDLFSYLYSILDENKQESIKIRAQSYFARISSAVSPAVLDKFTTFSKEQFFNIFQRPDFVRESSHSSLVNETTKITNSIQQMVQTAEYTEKVSQLFKKFESNFQSFIENNHKKTLLTSLYHDNMVTSFIRFVTSSNGPWSTTLDLSKSSINHWRVTTKINDYGYNIYWKHNRSFDDHKKASLLRDSMKITSEDEQKLDIIPNFHRILIQNSPFIASLSKTEKKQEKTFSFKVTQFTLLYHISGTIYVNDRRIFFEGSSFVENLGDPDEVIKDRPRKFIEISMNKVSFVFQRRHQHLEIGAEIFTTSNKSYFFIFESKEKRTDFIEIMKKATLLDKSKISNNSNTLGSPLFAPLQSACGCCAQTITCIELVSKSKITKLWQERKITTFLYLLYLNLISGRSFNDISQYPVYPWILCDYESETIDLNNPAVYRDLSKPIGAYNEERFEDLQKNLAMEDPFQRCLYRTFFSNPAVVAGYLIRTEPFTSLHIRLQGGKFDLTNRLFASVGKAWESVVGRQNDFRELIPEFFCSHHFLINENGFDLGKQVDDVELPRWASSAHEFVAINKMALESEFVSAKLHAWIDLIFGVDQISEERNNVYHLFSYTDILPQEITGDEDMFVVAQNHAINFGVCPNKLFKESHPTRNQTPFQITIPLFQSKSGKVTNKPSNTSPQQQTSSTQNEVTSPQQPPITAQTTIFEAPRHESTLDISKIPPLDANVACVRNGCVLTSKPSLFNVQQGSVQRLTLMHAIKEGTMVDFDDRFLFEVSRGGTHVSVVSIKTSEEVGILPHNNYEVTCISCIGNRAILVCGADCAIDIWKVEASSPSSSPTVSDVSSSVSSSLSETAAVAVGNTIIFLGTISSHSMPIVAVVGDFSLDIVVSIDEGSNVVISSLRDRKFIHTFKVECAPNSVHFLKLFESGTIVLSAHVPGEVNSSIFFFDFCGNVLKRINIDSCIEALEIISTRHMQEFVVVTTSNRALIVYECSNFKAIFNITCQIVPKFVSFVEQGEREVLVVKTKQKKQELATIEF